MSKSLTEMTAEIVQAQVGLTMGVEASDISKTLREVFRTLQEINRAETDPLFSLVNEITKPDTPPSEPVLAPEESIQADKIICLVCGKEMRQLTRRHLDLHGVSPKEYRKNYGFTMRTPLCATSLTKARKKAAKKRGLPANLLAYQEEKRNLAKLARAAGVGGTR